MELTKLIEGLHPLETQVLPILEKQNRLQEVVAETKLSLAAVMRAFQWLENKKIVKLSESSKEVVKLLPNGTIALKKGLPEKIFLQNIAKKPTDIRSLLKNAKQEKDEFNACLGILKKSLAIEINKGVISITDHGKKLMTKESLEEDFLRTLEKPRETKKLNAEEKFALENLKNRKNYVDIVKIKEKSAELTKLGKKILSKGLEKSKSEDRLTTEMLKTGKWKNKSFRRYDVEINVPKIHGGKRHFVGQAIESAKRIWTDMGFKEMSGPIVNTSFWNFDALFTAQDHPVREMQDTYYLENPKKGKLPEKQVKQVKKAHEDGAGTGSKGWGNIWDKEQAKLNVLRTHTTVLSAKTLAKLKKEKWPAKYFAVGKCFRNETLDWSHLFEFNQTEGIVIDPKANFRHLLGYLREFFTKMGFPKARFRPAFFPYTEPSVEIDVYHTGRKQWIELGGAGIFRPEVTAPLLGEEVPVLAWGPGFDRIILDYYKINDLRELYKNDLKQLREIKTWIR